MSVVGNVLYLMAFTRSDIVHSIGMLSKYIRAIAKLIRLLKYTCSYYGCLIEDTQLL